MCPTKTWSRYLLWFAHEHIDFRHAEIESILSMFNIPMRYVEKTPLEKPYWIVELPCEESAKKIASRSVLLKNCIELWSRARTIPQLHSNLRKCIENRTGHWVIPANHRDGELSDSHICPSSLIEACCPRSPSFKIEVETFCKHYTMAEKVRKIEEFHYLPLEGPVKLKNPDIKLAYFEFYGNEPNNIPEEPYHVFFGRWVADGQRDLIQAHSLKRRSFIGNTSMDAQLSILAANTAKVKNGDIVLDPFVGSGSLLVAAAHFGGYVWGTDIDFLMLHGKTRPTRVNEKVRKKEESVRGNMRQYGIEGRYLDLVVSDSSMPVWRDDMHIDAIITDPPYGVREPTERIGIDRENYTLTEQHLIDHVPAKVEYGLPHLYADLLELAAKHLRIGGRLVCWYPLVREEYDPTRLPWHPSLRLTSNSEQVLSKLTARRMLCYEKFEEYAPHSNSAQGVDATHNFREKYFTMGEATRRERKEKKMEETASYFAKQALRIESSITDDVT